MATIIAAKVQLQTNAQEVINQLIDAGFSAKKIASFYVNPPGQHATYPIGGDRYQSPNTLNDISETTEHKGFIAKAAEALIGVKSVDHAEASETASETVKDSNSSNEGVRGEAEIAEPTVDANAAVQVRRAGMLIAIELANPLDQNWLVTLLSKLGASSIEKVEGEIEDGQWLDFDPLSIPNYILP